MDKDKYMLTQCTYQCHAPPTTQQYPIRQASDISIDPWKGLVPYLFARLTELVDAIYIYLDHDGAYFLLLLSALLAARNAGKGKTFR